MNVAVYYPILKLSRLTQREPLGLFCWQLPFGLAGDASFARPWHTARELRSAAGDCKHGACTARQGLFAQKKQCFLCRNSATDKVFICRSSCWCHIAGDKRSLQRRQRVEMGSEGTRWPSLELIQGAAGITAWRAAGLCWDRELYLPAPCRNACTILHWIRSH